MTDLSVPFLWTQGMRPDSRGARPRAQVWQEVLWRRLTGRFGGLRTGDTTRDSEQILDIGRNIYFYVGACYPDFGLFVITFDEHSPDAIPNTRVSPFDTGGIAQGHTPMISAIEPSDIVGRESYAVGDYQSTFESWATSAYPARDDYPTPVRPTFVIPSEINLAIADDGGRAWMWEGRVAALDLASAPLRPTAIFFQPGRRIRYRDWVKKEARMSRAESEAHLALIARIGRDALDPAGDARRLVEGVA